jgi:hypothetical protein
LLCQLGLHPHSDPEALASLALENFKHFDDPDLKCVLSV